jgi:SAM-dependent methyltransferase
MPTLTETAPPQHTFQPEVTFSFGENWLAFLDSVSEESLQAARADVQKWLQPTDVANRTVLDVGSGSGIHSYCFHGLGARQLVSFDLDPRSVAATQHFWEQAGRPASWRVLTGSILDEDFLRSLGTYETVYAWGVLHHTGQLWKALDNACHLVAPGGCLWVSVYARGPLYPTQLALKQRYNRASRLGKRLILWREIAHLMRQRWRAGQNPLTWNQPVGRGMTTYHDLVDWLGGLPYEVSDREETVDFCQARGLALDKDQPAPQGGCSIYLFRRSH